MKRLLALLLSTLMVLGFAACGSTTENTSSGNASTQTTTQSTAPQASPTKNELAEKLTITWWPVGSYQTFADNRWDELMIEQMFNVDIKFEHKNIRDAKIRDAAFAAGEVYDVMATEELDVNNMYKQKLIRTIPKEWVAQYMPKYWSYLKNVNPDDPYPYPKDDSGIPDKTKWQMIPSYGKFIYDLTPWTCGFRLDWLEDFGYKFDDLVQLDKNGKFFSSNKQFTLKEFEEIIKQFVENDPDGNKQKDTVGILTTWAEFHYEYSALQGAFGFQMTNSNYLVKDSKTGKYTFFFASSQYRDMADWYQGLNKKGYLSLPAQGNLVSNITPLVQNSKLGYVENAPNTIESYMDAAKASNIAIDPNMKWVFTKPVKGPNGEAGLRRWGSTTVMNAPATIAHNVSDDKAKRILMILEYVATGDKKYDLRMGEAGKNYVWEGEPFKSFRKAETAEDKRFTPTFNYPTIQLSPDDVWMWATTQTTINFYAGLEKNGYSTFVHRPERAIDQRGFSADGWKKYNELKNASWKELSDLVGANGCKKFQEVVIDPSKDIKAEWESYLNTLKGKGLSEFENLFNDPKAMVDFKF